MRIALLSTLCFMGITLAATSAKAHEGAGGIIKQRMDAMKSIGHYAKTVGDMFKGKATFDFEHDPRGVSRVYSSWAGNPRTVS